MSVNLVVAAGLGDLADRLGDLLADRPPATGVPEVFGAEVVAVPSAGVESWLVTHLAERPLPQGANAPVIAGLDLLFPSSLVTRALGRRTAGPQWPTIGRLTWAVHRALSTDGDLAAAFATQPGASPLARARSLADLLDRYLLHRPEMLRSWEQGGAPPTNDIAHHQARLWLAVVRYLGLAVATAQQAEVAALASGELEPELPARLSLFGVSSLPALHCEVIAALGQQREVYLFAPAVSLPARQQVLDHDDAHAALGSVDHRLVRSWAAGNLEDHLALANLADSIEVVAGSPAGGGGAVGVSTPVSVPTSPTALLGQIQASVRAAIDPRSVEPLTLDPADRSIQWHRCYGPARQAEVVADAVRHLLEPAEGGAVLDFRDIVILCPDVSRFAPLVQAAFAGRDDVAEVPLAVTDLSLATTTPLVDVTVALLGLLDGRFRPADVLSLAGRLPVTRRFGLTPTDLADLGELVERVNVAWGIDPDDRSRYLTEHGGLTVTAPLGSRTWAEGFDQLVAGAVLADRPVHTTSTLPAVPLAGIEDPGTLASIGAFARLVDLLGSATTELRQRQSPVAWIDRLLATIDALVELTDDDAWQWRRLEENLASFAEDAVGFADLEVADLEVADLEVADLEVADLEVADLEVEGLELAALLQDRLGGAAGRARFGSGAVTLTSLTGLRGVPHRVVILLGLDGDVGAAGARADDLLAIDRRPGEPQPLREFRAQLLDAVLAAEDHLLILSTGTDPRSNKEVAPAVPLAELLAVVDDTVIGADGTPASVSVSVHHPRHAWSTPNFAGGDDAVVRGQRWGFDAASLAAARVRERVDGRRVADGAECSNEVWAPLGSDPGLVASVGEVSVTKLARALRNPVQAYLTERLGIGVPDDRSGGPDGLVDLRLDGLSRYNLVDELWDLIGPGSPEPTVLSVVEPDRAADPGAGSNDDPKSAMKEAWMAAQVARGALPPSPYLEAAFDDVDRLVTAFDEQVAALLDDRSAVRVPLAVGLGSGVTVTGDAVVVRNGDDSVVLDVRLAKRKVGDQLAGLVTLAAVTAQFPDERWTLHQLRRKPGDVKGDPVSTVVLTLVPQVDGEDAAEVSGAILATALGVLAWAVDYRDHALAGFFPALPATLGAVWSSLEATDGEDLGDAISAWGESEAEGSSFSKGDRTDRWVSMPGETPEFEELWALAPTVIEADWVASMPADAPGVDHRLGVWARRLWGRALQFATGLDPKGKG